MSEAPLSPEEFEARLRAIGDERYHHRHPFNVRMHEGTLTQGEIRTWVRNRYYYQTRIPIKDGLILAKSQDPEFRRQWVHRIHDHDGQKPGEGGLELWLALGEAVGLSRDEVADTSGVLPGVRDACDAYVEFVSSHDLLESVASSLTELFAPHIMKERIAAFEKHYPWVKTEGLAYFRSRVRQASDDSRHGLAFVISHAKTREDQERCLRALERKCEILWRLLDAIDGAGLHPVVSKHAELRDEGERLLAVLPERAVEINPSGREILELCDGRRSAAEIAAELSRRHPGAENVSDDVHRFLSRMDRVGVIRWSRE
jgi:pyrroloquinoline-quinone synthase